MAGTVITKKGLQLIAKLVASGTALTFTRVSVGTGSVPAGYDPGNMTDLNNYKMDGSISSCSFLGDEASIIMQISSLGVETGFTITETGLFATDPDEGEILYSYLDLSKDPQYVYEENSAISKFVEMTLVVKVGTVERVTAQLNPRSLLTRDGDISDTSINELEPIDTKYPVPSAGESAKVFLGKVKKYIEDTKPLDADMTVYVATTGSDTTGDGTSSKPYKTITYALSRVPRDLGGYTATVNIADGTYNESVNITGYTGGYLYLKRNGAQELNDLCNIISISVQYCSNVSVTGFNLTNTKGTSVFANMCEFVNMAYCQSIVTTVSDEVSFDFDYVSVGRIGMCRSLNHNMCLRSYSSNVTSFSWSDDSWGTYGIFSDGGGRITKGNTFQPRGLVTNEVTPGGSIIASNYGARIGTLPADITIYVATTGSDTAGNGSVSSPYASITKALSTVPRDLGGYAVIINIADGTYNEDVRILGFHSGEIYIRTSMPDTLNQNTKINTLYVKNCDAFVSVEGLQLLGTNDMTVVGIFCTHVRFQALTLATIPATGIGIFIAETNLFRIYNCNVNGRNHAIRINNSKGYITTCSGTSNNIGMYASSATIIHVAGTTITATTPMAQENGGMFVNQNGTQISGLITSGLSCTWGTLVAGSGGYYRIGNLAGVAQVIIQLQITTTSALTAGTTYYITGFPLPSLSSRSTVPVTCHFMYSNGNCYLDTTGRIVFTPGNAIPSGVTLIFGCTYITNS